MSKLGGRWSRPRGFASKMWIPDGAEYDRTLPDRYEKFCGDYLRFPEGVKGGLPVEWDNWQLDKISRPLLGLRWSATGRRVIRQALMVSGRGNAKTTKAAALALFFLVGMRERNPEIDLFALSSVQAGRMFRVVERFILAHPTLDRNLNISSHRKIVKVPETGGELVVRTGDANREVGLIPSLAIIDELLSQRNSDLWDAVRTSMGKRPDSVLLSFTTPAIGPESFAEGEYRRAKDVVADRSIAPHYLPIIFEADKDDDVFSPRTWRKANPALRSGFLAMDVVRSEAEAARRDPKELHSLKVFRCALWPEAGHGFLDMLQWDKAAVGLPPRERLAELPCFVGIDMGGWDDLTSACFLFWDREADVCYAMWKHWSTLRSYETLNHFTNGDWRRWDETDSCDLTIHTGKWVDGTEVADWVAEKAKEFKVISIGVDSYRSGELIRLLGDEGYGLPIQQLATTGKSMQAGTERIAAAVEAGQLRHSGDPLARWCASNAAVKYDAWQYPKVVKPDPDENRTKIDAVVAACFAADRWLWWERTQQDHIPDEGWLPWDEEDDKPADHFDNEDAPAPDGEERPEAYLPWDD